MVQIQWVGAKLAIVRKFVKKKNLRNFIAIFIENVRINQINIVQIDHAFVQIQRKVKKLNRANSISPVLQPKHKLGQA